VRFTLRIKKGWGAEGEEKRENPSPQNASQIIHQSSSIVYTFSAKKMFAPTQKNAEKNIRITCGQV
jgi:hypothetical protein